MKILIAAMMLLSVGVSAVSAQRYGDYGDNERRERYEERQRRERAEERRERERAEERREFRGGRRADYGECQRRAAAIRVTQYDVESGRGSAKLVRVLRAARAEYERRCGG